MPLIFTGIIFPLISFLVYELAVTSSQDDAYWILRAKPFLIMVTISLSSFLLIALTKKHLRKEPNLVFAICIISVGFYYFLNEYFRLEPYVGQNGLTWKNVIPYFDSMVIIGIVFSIIILAISSRLSLPKKSNFKKFKNDTFGSSSFMEMKKAAEIFPSDGEIVIGERYRVDEDNVNTVAFDPSDKSTWGKGGTQPLLTYKLNFDSTHMLFFAGSGGFKTTSNVIPTCLKYTGPMVVFDPSTEIAPMVTNARNAMPGRQVIVLDPHGKVTKAFNPLDWLLDENLPLHDREADIVDIARLLLSENSNSTSSDQFFISSAHNLLTGLLAYIVFDNEVKPEEKNLLKLRELVSKPEPLLIEKLREIQSTSSSKFIQETLGVFTNMTEQTFSSVYATASKDTQWLSLSNYAYLVSGSDFKTSDIAKGNIDIFLNIPSKILKSYPSVGRIIVGSFLKAMESANGNYSKRVLFVLDELDLLGYMNILEEARDRGRKYGVSLMMFYQSVGQINRHFGDSGATAWFESCAFVSYAAIKDIETAKGISASCGEMTVEVQGSSKAKGLFAKNKDTESFSLQQRPLIYPHEITQTMRKDEQIIIIQGQSPIRCGRAIFFRRNDLLKLSSENRFAKKSK